MNQLLYMITTIIHLNVNDKNAIPIVNKMFKRSQMEFNITYTDPKIELDQPAPHQAPIVSTHLFYQSICNPNVKVVKIIIFVLHTCH